jgi:thiosulfate/3-mercaptopyruvate sulfurtransferase
VSIKKLMRDKRVWLLSGLFLAALPLAFNGCGTTYDVPSTTQTPNALISAATLKSWIDAGLVNGTGYDRVVILDVNTCGGTHIPGALCIPTGNLSQNRTEGIAVSNSEVLSGLDMDALIQNAGIDGSTTIVFTGASLIFPTRAYFTFRYWGFPKNRLKVLDGVNVTWNTLYGLTTDPSPAVTPSKYSVQNIGVLGDRFRLSLAEMIDYADGKVPNALAIDVRSSATGGSYAGIRAQTGSNFAGCVAPTVCADFAVFEGRIRGAKALVYSSLYNAATFIFNSPDLLRDSFTTIGLNSTKTAYIYCRFGFQGAPEFFALDGILGWPAAFYDGSWSQWGQLSGDASMKGQLASDSRWRTDIPSRSELIVYNFSSPSQVSFVGIGLNDATSGGTPVGGPYTFVVEIDGTGTTDTFKWSSDGGTTWTGLLAPIDGSPQLLGATGVTVTFAATTGHTSADRWVFNTGAKVAVEQLTADGSACSATYLAAGGITNSSGGATECTNPPNSTDDNANRVEEDDRIYIKSGSGGSGSGGGGGGAC